MDRDNTEKLTLQDYEAEGLCSGCMFYGAVDVDGRLGCSFHWFDDESEDWNYSKNCDGQCSILMRPVELCMGHTTKKKMSSFEITTL